jgi:DNA-binding XRE family transcriptional regulator
MSEPDATSDDAQRLTPRQVALADIAERRRRDPDWNPRADPTYVGPHPTFVGLMSDAEFDDYMARRERGRPQVEPRAGAICHAGRPGRAQPVVRAALPFGQRIRDLRRATGWTQREAARQLGVSARSIIRYEQGSSSPVQAEPLLALRRLESAHAMELDFNEVSRGRFINRSCMDSRIR